MRATWQAGAPAWSGCYASAHPPFALERLEQLANGQLIYRLAKPHPRGTTQLRLTPLELIERLATLILPPLIHRHRYHGVLAPMQRIAPR